MSIRAWKTWLAWCVLFATLCITSAIFEEQLGEFDWKRENIGIIDSSFVIRDQLVVSTADGVLACLNSKTGGTTWRVVLPQHSKVLKFVEVDGHLVTLVSQPTTSSSKELGDSVTVRGWSVVDGSLLWDSFLGTTCGGADSALDLMYVSSNKQLTALFGNALHIITTSSNQASSWTWSAETDLAATLPSHADGLTLTLSSLIAPTYTPDQTRSRATNANTNTRTAVGCFVRGAASKGAVCEGEAVLVKVGGAGSNSAVSLETLPLSSLLPEGHTVRVGDVAAVVASDASLPYQFNDVVFAATRSAQGKLSLAVLSLEPSQQKELEQVVYFSLENTSAGDEVKSFVFVDTGGELRPAVSVCPASFFASAAACRSFVAHSPSPALATAAGKWSLQSLLKGAADCEGQDVRLQYGSFNFYDRVVHSLTCTSVTVGSAGHLASISIKATSSRPSNNKAAASAVPHQLIDDVSLDLASLEVVVPPFQPSTFSAVHHLAVLSTKPSSGNSGGSNNCVDRSLLVVLRSGHTLMLSASSCGVKSNEVVVQWERFEGLARAQQAVVMDRAQAATAAGADDEDHRMPNFVERLALQRAKLLVRSHQTYTSKPVFFFKHGIFKFFRF